VTWGRGDSPTQASASSSGSSKWLTTYVLLSPHRHHPPYALLMRSWSLLIRPAQFLPHSFRLDPFLRLCLLQPHIYIYIYIYIYGSTSVLCWITYVRSGGPLPAAMSKSCRSDDPGVFASRLTQLGTLVTGIFTMIWGFRSSLTTREHWVSTRG
jgi:hypothetical protein